MAVSLASYFVLFYNFIYSNAHFKRSSALCQNQAHSESTFCPLSCRQFSRCSFSPLPLRSYLLPPRPPLRSTPKPSGSIRIPATPRSASGSTVLKKTAPARAMPMRSSTQAPPSTSSASLTSGPAEAKTVPRPACTRREWARRRQAGVSPLPRARPSCPGSCTRPRS